jgi:hypothetical protein
MYAMYLYLYPWCSVVGIIKAREAAVLKNKIKRMSLALKMLIVEDSNKWLLGLTKEEVMNMAITT